MTNIPSSQEKSQELPSLGSFAGEVMSRNRRFLLFFVLTVAVLGLTASSEARQARLDLFKETFGLKDWRYGRKAEPYLLLFLSVVSLSSSLLAEFSDDHEKGQWMESLERWIKPGKR
jgi:hypothetical protein